MTGCRPPLTRAREKGMEIKDLPRGAAIALIALGIASPAWAGASAAVGKPAPAGDHHHFRQSEGPAL